MSIRILQLVRYMILKRSLHSFPRHLQSFDPRFPLKCGLEVHTQLKTKYKLFSLSPSAANSSNVSDPNSSISYFDIGLPGTQPKLNPEALLLALRLSAALDCKIALNSKFDRKHYFYPDQPLGYQITQYYHPLARSGILPLSKAIDNLRDDKCIRIAQIQIEQDTGKLLYDDFQNLIKIDLNRANVPLIELITEPDFENLSQIKAFLKKYQLLVKHLGVCTGDLETGAMRVDVNISINNGNRVEIKNLGSTSEIQSALLFEYNRQVEQLKLGNVIDQETRGWNGKETVKLRSKEDSVDYRYFPDSELPTIKLDSNIKSQILQTLPESPDSIITKLMTKPYLLELKHSKFLMDNMDLLQYYYQLFDIIVVHHNQPVKVANNWIIHELLGAFNKLSLPLDLTLLPVKVLGDLILHVVNDTLTLTAARTVLLELLRNPSSSINDHVEAQDLAKPKNVSQTELDEAVTEICQDVIQQNPDVVERIKNGKPKSINFLLGLAMKETQGKVSSKLFLDKFKELLQ